MISAGLAVFTDLDGTLLDETQSLSFGNRKTLNELGEKGVCRVVVTGRNLVSASRVIDSRFPIDVLVTSSGAGIYSFPDKQLLRGSTMRAADARRAAALLECMGVDFMIHDPVPHNHKFSWRRNLGENPDFDRRLKLNTGCHRDLPKDLKLIGKATQLLAICPTDKNSDILQRLRTKLFDLTVIRTTSPLDQKSIWYEIFPRGTSKASASAWVCGRYELDLEKSLAVGNDYNDVDLLLWSPFSRVVKNAPLSLRRKFTAVSSNNDDGFSEAVKDWWRSVTA